MRPHVNKIVFRSCAILLVLTFFILDAYADIVKLKNGGRIEGIIEQESGGKVTVEIKSGEIMLSKTNIETIERATSDYNNLLKQRWDKEKAIAKTEVKQPVAIKTPTTHSVISPKTQTQTKTPTQPVQQIPQKKPGVITIVRCEDGQYSYAACLPVNYDEKNRYPVLFCFDPGADGSGAVRRFAFAAEKYGWIVVGSLNAQNGPWDPIVKAQSAMLNDIQKRYKVAEDKYYAAGFSGGARMSYTIAYNHPVNFKGVIACGAGLGQGTISKKVLVYNCVGEDDSNIKEVKMTYEVLRKKGVKSELRVFPGGHDWPPDLIIKQAVDWIAKN